jgi:hypothetical protein
MEKVNTIHYSTSKIKLRGCNCQQCRLAKTSRRKGIRLLNRNIRYENKKICRNPEAIFNSKMSNYFA